MKIRRSTICSLKFANKRKLDTLQTVLAEYGRVVNEFIEQFWLISIGKSRLVKTVLGKVDTWLTSRLRVVAAREAVDMIKSAKEAAKERDEKPRKPVHKSKRIHASALIASLSPAKKATEFDCWLHLSSMGNKISLDLPIRRHKHFNYLAERGKRLESYIITAKSVQFCFEIETGPKRTEGKCVGVDTGIKKLATLSNGKKFGTDIEEHIKRIKRCKHGSKGQKRARRTLKQRMCEVAKEVVANKPRLVVVEKLKNLNKKTKVKRRLTKSMRRTIGNWNYREWLKRLQMACEWTRCSFRSVPSYYTSQRCPVCGHTDRRNRSGEKFLCQKCGYAGDADVTAAKNILERFLSGPYSAGFKATG